MLIDFFKNRVSKNFFLNGFDIKFKKTELSKTKLLIILIMTYNDLCRLLFCTIEGFR